MEKNFVLQPQLEDVTVRLRPLKQNDFEILYEIASDPLIWEQHPNKDRYKREVFQVFFAGAMTSGGAFLIFDKKSGQAIGSSRFYDWQPEKNRVTIGYTFFGRDHWGGEYNPRVKALMLNHAFQYVDEVYFHIGAVNVRSQKALEKLGAIKIQEINMAYHGEKENLNFVYLMTKEKWNLLQQKNK